MRELTIVTHIVVSEAAVKQEAGNVSVLRFVGCVKLCCMIVHPDFELFLWSFLVEQRRSLPFVENTAPHWGEWGKWSVDCLR